MSRKTKLIYPILLIILGLVVITWFFIPKKPTPLKPTITMEAVKEGAEYPDKVQYDSATGNYKYYYPYFKEKYWVFEPGTKIKGKINVKIEFAPAIETYNYNYKVFSSKSSLQDINIFTLACQVPVTNIVPRHPSEPSDWWALPALLDKQEPLIQWAGVRAGKIKPGGTQTGFSFESKGLPGIVDSYLKGYVPLPPPFPEGYAPGDKPPNFFHNSIKGKTVGPVAVPEPFNSEEFLNNLISLKNESFKLGWIDNRMLSFRLGNRLKAIGKAINEKNIPRAKDLTQSFIKEVAPLKDRHLTPEAYYILKFNAQYLLDHLT